MGASAAGLLKQLEQDRESGAPIMKEAAAWVGEKLSELKFGRGAFGTFEALEALALGILGKLALWQALETIADADIRLREVDFKQLAARGERQHAQAEQLRLESARAAFAPVQN